MKEHTSPAVIRAVQSERAALLKKRSDLVADIDRQISELDEFLDGATAGVESIAPVPAAPQRRQSFSAIVIDCALNMIQDGRPKTTPQIRDELIRRKQLPAEELTVVNDKRITKVLSSSGLFNGHRSHGWSLKGEAPGVGASEASIATKAE